MEHLEMIAIVCVVMWYIIDRLKGFWQDNAYGKYITMVVSAVGSFALAIGYRLDIMMALGLSQEATIIGICMTALTLMGGSSAFSELMQLLKHKS